MIRLCSGSMEICLHIIMGWGSVEGAEDISSRLNEGLEIFQEKYKPTPTCKSMDILIFMEADWINLM